MASPQQPSLPGFDSSPSKLRVVRSTHVEQLVTALANDLAVTAPADPLTPVTLVVQSRGMQRWLSHQLAQQTAAPADITANVAFPFPGAMIRTVVEACGITVGEPDPWEPRHLTWHVCDVLAAAADEPILAPVRRFIAERNVISRRAYAFAKSVAEAFDRYVLYRSDLLAQWNRGHVDVAGHAWQPWLWRQLTATFGDPTERLAHTIRALRAVDEQTTGLPTHVALFGLSTLPPRYLDVFAALAARIQVTWYLPVPSMARWQTVTRAADHLGDGDPDGADRDTDDHCAGHPLVETCGRISDDTARLLRHIDVDDQIVGTRDQQTAAADASGDINPWTSGQASSALQVFQRGIASDDPQAFAAAVDSKQIDLADGSIQIHQCHSLPRQVDVLRDVLLGLFADHPHLQPRDVLLLTPDVETVGPLLQAAAVGDEQRPGFPVRIADRRVDRDDPVIAAVRAVLELARSRCSATDVLDVLAHPPIAARFGLAADDLHDAARWVRDTGIRWGIDGAHRARHGQPDEPHHTWRAGLDRLLLGMAMADEDDRIVGGTVPYDHVEGDVTERVGAFVAACGALFDVITELRPASRETWADRILAIATELLALDAGDTSQLRTLSRIVDLLASVPSARSPSGKLDQIVDVGGQLPAGFASLTDLDTVVAAFDDAIGASGPASAYETGAVTVCEFIPMRSIPQRVIGLIGMDDGAFPRAGRLEGFDLTQADDRVGDRHRRDEDRHLFLEAIMAARDHLLVFTTTRDLRTNQSVPASVVVTELLEALGCGDGSQPHVSQHPLHSYNPRMFGHERAPLSFDQTLLPAAQAVLAGSRNEPPFIAPGETLDIEPATHVDLQELATALGDPTQFFVERQVGVYLHESSDQQSDTQPIDTDPLTTFDLGQQFLSRPADEQRLRATIARGVVPAGALGVVTVSVIDAEANALRQRLIAECERDGQNVDVANVHYEAIDLTIAGMSLTGMVGPVFVAAPADADSGEMVVAHERFAKQRDRHLLRLWIDHLALQAARNEPIVTVGVWRASSRAAGGKPAVTRLRPVATGDCDVRAAASTHLGELLDIFALARTRPIPLFDVSRTFARSGDFAGAAHAFRSGVHRSRQRDGVSPALTYDRHRYLEWVYGEDCDLATIVTSTGDEFAQIAHRVWDPIHAHLSVNNRQAAR